MSLSVLRTRWAAVGAAVAVTLGAGGLGISYATDPSGAVAYVPITPCRLIDTRPAPDTVGSRSTALGPEETLTVTAHGANGNCTAGSVIPATATGLQLNVTAIGATAPTFLTLWPFGATQPTASNLNPQPGQGPVPNSVTTGLSVDGKFNVYNRQGTVNVFVDVVGYYTDHTHDDRYYTKAEVDAAVASRPATATGKLAYAWVCSSASITPLGTVSDLSTTCGNYAYNPGGSPTSDHTATGRYVITFPGLGLAKGQVQVTGYGSTTDTCKVSTWNANTVTVVCFDSAGVAVDGRFNVLVLE